MSRGGRGPALIGAVGSVSDAVVQSGAWRKVISSVSSRTRSSPGCAAMETPTITTATATAVTATMPATTQPESKP